MDTFICERCNKEFKTKHGYQKHITKKIPCEDNKKREYLVRGRTCNNCGKVFQRPNLLTKHIERCKGNDNHGNDTISNLNNIEVGEVVTVGGKFKCYFCELKFNDLILLERHCKLQCKCNNLYNNIYKFDSTKSGKHIFGTEKSGELYIVKNNFDVENVYKIGITENICKRISDYRCGTINEPALMYYFPCKDIKVCDKIMKGNLLKLKVKREIYKGDLVEINKILEESLKPVNGDEFYCFEPEFKEKDVDECIFCKRIFCSQKNLHNHTINCQQRGKQDQEKEDLMTKLIKEKEEQNIKMEDQNNKIKEIEKNLADKDKKMEEILATMKNMEKIIKNGTINNIQNAEKIQNNTLNNTVNNINIIAYGKEDLSHILETDYRRILNKGFKSVPAFVESVHFNKKKPENHNVYISNMRDNHALVYDGKEWQLQERDNVLQDMIDNKTEILHQKFDQIVNDLDEFTVRKFRRFLNESDDNAVINSIKKDLKLLLYNKRGIVEDTKNIERK
jgi:hypothetical protein